MACHSPQRTHFGPSLHKSLEPHARTRCGLLICPPKRSKQRARRIRWSNYEHLVTCRSCAPWIEGT
jgi:hypothetical protein